MNKLNFSFVYKKFKKRLQETYGKEIALLIWKKADAKLKNFSAEYKNIGSDEKIMILPLAAIYLSMKEENLENPLELLNQYGKETGERFSKLIRKITSFPGVPELLWKNMSSLMRKNSSPKKGYQRKIISETKELVAGTNSCAMCKRLVINSGIEKIIVRDDKINYRIIEVDDWIKNDESLDAKSGY
jgi:hypothetical protein